MLYPALDDVLLYAVIRFHTSTSSPTPLIFTLSYIFDIMQPTALTLATEESLGSKTAPVRCLASEAVEVRISYTKLVATVPLNYILAKYYTEIDLV